MTAEQIVRSLKLEPHPEGGFYKEVYRAEGCIEKDCLQGYFNDKRSFSTSIYYLLEKGDFSAFHRIKSDEIWHYYYGGSAFIHLLHPRADYQCKIVGSNIEQGASFQVIIPAGTWFAAEPAPDTEFILAGCTVAPGFDFNDFELADKDLLTKEYPQNKALTERLCR